MMSNALTTALYRNKHHNCLNLVISAILLRNKVRIEYLWGQAALVINEDDYIDFVTPYYTEWGNYFSQYHGIQLYEKNFLKPQEYIYEICKILKVKKSVGVEVDVYELPYCIHYKTQNNFHAIEIIGVNGDKFEICDHYFNYHGNLTFKQFELALTSYLTNFPECTPIIYDFDIEKHLTKKYEHDDLIQAVKNNINIMKGNDISFFNSNKKNKFLGVNTFPVLVERLTHIFSVPKKDSQEVLIDFYYSLKEIANSRYNFYQFLKMFSQNLIAEEYLNVANSWLVAANLLLRAEASGNHAEFLPRIGKRFNFIFEKEVENLEMLENLIKD